MEDIICSKSAFNFYRTPPSVLESFPEPAIGRISSSHKEIANDNFVASVLVKPINTLLFEHSRLTKTPLFIKHHLDGELPRGALREVEGLSTFTSPAMTLFLMTRDLSVPHLTMAMYEMCGGFTVFHPNQAMREHLSTNFLDKRIDSQRGWRQVFDLNEEPTNLWKRPPLVTVEELNDFAAEVRDRRCGADFEKALKLVVGETLSPLEVQTAIMLHVSRRLGGFGLAIKTNERIAFTKQARLIAQQDFAVADIYIEGPDGYHCVDVECQGAMIHDSAAKGVADAQRTAALESMGISVVPVTFSQLQDTQRFDAIVKLIHQKLGVKYREKTKAMKEREAQLRKEVLIDWAKLGERSRIVKPRKKRS